MLKISKVLHNYDLPLKTRYTFCLVPYNIGKSNSKENLLVSVIERYIGGQPITANFIATLFRWPLKLGKNLDQLTKLEDAYEFFDVYLWLSYRFPDMFTEPEKIRDMQIELNKIILETIRVIIFQDEPKCDDELLNNLLTEEIPETEENITDEIALEDFRVEFEADGVEVEAREEKENQETNTIQNEEKKLI
uniref:Mitochondrial degradasome RNA helicase subunit C-terminal domain-containing protein n=1 Tax=Acrobeloides nanus TaxID=290746 RepID=A0A914D0H4_9BILA